MDATRCSGWLVALIIAARVAALAGAAGLASATEPAYTPMPYQPGKDVVWLPSNADLVDRMLDMVQLRPDDYLVDLGSGDGITVIRAAQRGARAHGIEYNPDLVALAKGNARSAGVADRATFVQGDIFKSDFSKATVVALFLTSELNLRLRPTLLAMKPGTRVVSNTFDMLDWSPDVSHRRSAGCAISAPPTRGSCPRRSPARGGSATATSSCWNRSSRSCRASCAHRTARRSRCAMRRCRGRRSRSPSAACATTVN